MTAQLPPAPPPQWLRDLTTTPPTPKPKTAIPDPPGFTSSTKTSKTSNKTTSTAARKPPSPEEMDTLKLKKAWEMAIAPAKSLPMNAFGMYMTGNSLQIFSIMMVFMLFKTPITALLNVQGTFARLETEGNKSQMVMVKLAFIGCNLLALGLGIWKVNGMGLLPYVFVLPKEVGVEMRECVLTFCFSSSTTRSDWLAWELPREPIERAYFVPS
ncbi:hypothetical protein KC318_g7487 [Hortaea werneckii]|uniref:ER membrane protein complex subunit 4 n=1 Tax=Hortaea werneckii TaxID=91943 RepID=A0A3M6YV70_HORWE|nr:hypothetical protein KC334_g3230 [Hortaea werneckii]KAI7025472.1 hypothetical protein KC355_g1006 [Hortaea werneckii]KAI7184625.1 hypothetical protein KC324_g7642 [Hortaea werneckii]KAI7582557.1 hypothetical protein KC316_g7787 [Hortaea werneckii]KAI7664842.1 hypothetical protein KC318_g7487 [Hortaea werneckii]